MNRACGAAALVRVINPDCECKSGAAPERISKGMYEYSGEAYLGHFTVLFFFFFFSYVPVRGNFLRLTVLWRYCLYLSVTGKENQFGARAHGKKKKRGGVVESVIARE